MSSLLTLCDEFDLHIKEHSTESRKYIRNIPTDTHYIMRGELVLASLNEVEIERWVNNKAVQAKSIKQLLNAEVIDISDVERCERSLSETVSPKKNVEIYRALLK